MAARGAGGSAIERIPVTDLLDGTDLKIPVHVVTGRENGPTMALISCLHGNEWDSAEMLRVFTERVDTSRLRGTILIVPVANPPAFGTQTRNTRDLSDVGDLNRVFPGGPGWLNYQIARALTDGVLKRADYYIDFHPGTWGSAMQNVGYGGDFSDRSLVERSYRMALAYGVYSVRQMRTVTTFPGPGSVAGYAGEVLGIPGLAVSVGGSGFADEHETRWREANIRGILSVLRHLDMYDTDDDAHRDTYVHSAGRGAIINPQRAGTLVPEVTPDDFTRVVKRGELLARVYSPYTFELLEELVMPSDGVLFCVPRRHPVGPGSWAFFAADLGDPTTKVISRDTPISDL